MNDKTFYIMVFIVLVILIILFHIQIILFY
jgi:hypothetical protein